MASVKPRGKVPKEASVGEIIEIKTLLNKSTKLFIKSILHQTMT